MRRLPGTDWLETEPGRVPGVADARSSPLLAQQTWLACSWPVHTRSNWAARPADALNPT